MTSIKITVDADGRAQNLMLGAITAIKNFKPALKDTKSFQLKEVQKQFTTRGAQINGSRWAKRKRSVSWPLLEKSGKLRRSFKDTKLTKQELQITSKVKYYGFHQKGTSKMVQRRILAHSRSMIKKVVNIFIKYIDKTAQSNSKK